MDLISGRWKPMANKCMRRCSIFQVIMQMKLDTGCHFKSIKLQKRVRLIVPRDGEVGGAVAILALLVQ